MATSQSSAAPTNQPGFLGRIFGGFGGGRQQTTQASPGNNTTSSRPTSTISLTPSRTTANAKQAASRPASTNQPMRATGLESASTASSTSSDTQSSASSSMSNPIMDPATRRVQFDTNTAGSRQAQPTRTQPTTTTQPLRANTQGARSGMQPTTNVRTTGGPTLDAIQFPTDSSRQPTPINLTFDGRTYPYGFSERDQFKLDPQSSNMATQLVNQRVQPTRAVHLKSPWRAPESVDGVPCPQDGIFPINMSDRGLTPEQYAQAQQPQKPQALGSIPSGPRIPPLPEFVELWQQNRRIFGPDDPPAYSNNFLNDYFNDTDFWFLERTSDEDPTEVLQTDADELGDEFTEAVRSLYQNMNELYNVLQNGEGTLAMLRNDLTRRAERLRQLLPRSTIRELVEQGENTPINQNAGLRCDEVDGTLNLAGLTLNNRPPMPTMASNTRPKGVDITQEEEPVAPQLLNQQARINRVQADMNRR